MKTLSIGEIQVLNSEDIKNKLNFKKSKIDELIYKGTFVGVLFKGKLFITKKSFSDFIGIKNDEDGWENFNKEMIKRKKEDLEGKRSFGTMKEAFED